MHPPFQYLGYTGTVEFCTVQRTYSGCLEETADAVTYEALSLDALKANFEAAVDEYIQLCTEIADSGGSDEGVENLLSIHVADSSSDDAFEYSAADEAGSSTIEGYNDGLKGQGPAVKWISYDRKASIQ